jgi:hypothetical protein
MYIHQRVALVECFSEDALQKIILMSGIERISVYQELETLLLGGNTLGMFLTIVKDMNEIDENLGEVLAFIPAAEARPLNNR